MERSTRSKTRQTKSAVFAESSPPPPPSTSDASEERHAKAVTALRASLQPYSYSYSHEKANMEPAAATSGKLARTLPAKSSTKRQSVLNLKTLNPKSSQPKNDALTKKRRGDEVADENSPPSPETKRRKTTVNKRAAGDPANPENKLVDSLRPGLILVLIGLNPGLTTGLTGHAYAHPSNLYWRMLNWSGITPICHKPSETHDLPDLYSIGNTNIVVRPTRSESGLSKQEMIDGAVTLGEKIRHFKPEAVCIVGKSIWQAIYKEKTGKNLKNEDFHYGWQDDNLRLGRKKLKNGTDNWDGAKTFVATTTSALAAGMSQQDKIDIWKPLGEWFTGRRNGTVKAEGEEEVKAEDDAEA